MASALSALVWVSYSTVLIQLCHFWFGAENWNDVKMWKMRPRTHRVAASVGDSAVNANLDLAKSKMSDATCHQLFHFEDSRESKSKNQRRCGTSKEKRSELPNHPGAMRKYTDTFLLEIRYKNGQRSRRALGAMSPIVFRKVALGSIRKSVFTSKLAKGEMLWRRFATVVSVSCFIKFHSRRAATLVHTWNCEWYVRIEQSYLQFIIAEELLTILEYLMRITRVCVQSEFGRMASIHWRFCDTQTSHCTICRIAQLMRISVRAARDSVNSEM